ncbi:hypothetical protein LEP1GSC024_0915 [Leptospira noguchii str. 2001034031]|uniref:Uncharacterized protein n=1 Tax=Leptospira noguchii str. 2001034031 TaxID=1193053 RepID=M6Y624_9LEPT|nr:hypothetical protein LEP1GSC024_0915 [Leptospira noguchii str. 2001034031]
MLKKSDSIDVHWVLLSLLLWLNSVSRIYLKNILSLFKIPIPIILRRPLLVSIKSST